MATIAPLQILLFRHAGDAEFVAYEDAVVRAFQGGKEAGTYLVSGEDLGAELRAPGGTPPGGVTGTLLDSYCHTLTVILIDNSLLEKSDDALWDWFEECWARVSASGGRHAVLAVAMDERTGRAFCQKRQRLQGIQLLRVTDLGEQSIRPAMLALRILHRCRLLLADGLESASGQKAGHLRLFISHAKADGLPLAYALKHQIESLGWLEDFYDADDLPAGCDWQRELEMGVGSSLIVMLRTEIYDSRYWCQQEVQWADEYAVPAVLIDARTQLNYPAASLPFDRVPVVRIPDGNLIRVLFVALREGLRFLLFKRRVEQMKQSGELPSPAELRVFSYRPSMSALLRTCRSLAESKTANTTPRLIVHPDPPLPTGLYEAAQALVERYAPGTRLVTPETLAATAGAGR